MSERDESSRAIVKQAEGVDLQTVAAGRATQMQVLLGPEDEHHISPRDVSSWARAVLFNRLPVMWSIV